MNHFLSGKDPGYRVQILAYSHLAACHGTRTPFNPGRLT